MANVGETVAKYVGHKVSKVRWIPQVQGQLNPSESFVTGGWDDQASVTFSKTRTQFYDLTVSRSVVIEKVLSLLKISRLFPFQINKLSVWKVEEPGEDSAAAFNVTNEPKLLCETNYAGDVTDVEVC